jgi:hypothetical protein
MMPIRVLIGGEATRTIASAFELRGHYALTADFRPAQRPGPHHQGDWWEVMDQGWDLAIFHPTCTFMANSGSKHLFLDRNKKGGLNRERWTKMGEAAWSVWDLLERCPIRRVAIENPVMLRYAQIMSGLDKLASQTVQPWWFGDDPDGPDNTKKATCWWTRGGLPKLVRTGSLDGSTARDEVFKMAPTEDPEERRMARSNFTPGHAAAIADQWGRFVETELAAQAS